MQNLSETVDKALQSHVAGHFAADALELLRSEPLLAVVQALKDHLTDGDIMRQRAALALIASVLTEGQPRSDITPPHLLVVVEHFAAKVATPATSEVCLAGLSDVVRCYSELLHRTSSNEPPAILECCVQALSGCQVQVMSREVRQKVFALYHVLLHKHSECCVDFGGRFINAFLSAADGERDPELILQVLDLQNVLMQQFPPEVVAFAMDDLYELVTAYFPVVVALDEGSPVSADKLRDCIHDALSRPAFHQQCLPFMCSKLQSPAFSCKAGALDVMKRALLKQSIGDIGHFLPEVLSTLRNEILKWVPQADDPSKKDLLQSASTLLSVLGDILGVVGDEVAILSIVNCIVDGFMSTLETDSASVPCYATMLHSLAIGCSRMCATLLKDLLPRIMEVATRENVTPHQKLQCFAGVAALVAAAEVCCGRGDTTHLLDVASKCASSFDWLLKDSRVAFSEDNVGKPNEERQRICVDIICTTVVVSFRTHWISAVLSESLLREVIEFLLLRCSDDSVRAAAMRTSASVANVDSAFVIRVFLPIIESAPCSNVQARIDYLDALIAASPLLAQPSIEILTKWAKSDMEVLPAVRSTYERAMLSLPSAEPTFMFALCSDWLLLASAQTTSRNVSRSLLQVLSLTLSKALRETQIEVLSNFRGRVCDETWLCALSTLSPRDLQEVAPNLDVNALAEGCLAENADVDDVGVEVRCALLCRALEHLGSSIPQSVFQKRGSRYHVDVLAAIHKGIVLRNECEEDGKKIIREILWTIDAESTLDSALRAISSFRFHLKSSPSYADTLLRSLLCEPPSNGALLVIAETVNALRGPRAEQWVMPLTDVLRCVASASSSNGMNEGVTEVVKALQNGFSAETCGAVIDAGPRIVGQLLQCLKKGRWPGVRSHAADLLCQLVKDARDNVPLRDFLKPLRSLVLTATREAIDDDKRCVRESAAACRHLWHLLK